MRINGSLALETIDDTRNTTITIEHGMIAVITKPRRSAFLQLWRQTNITLVKGQTIRRVEEEEEDNNDTALAR